MSTGLVSLWGAAMRKWLNFAQPILSVVLGLMLGLTVTWFAGENPFHVLDILFVSAFGSRYDFGMTLFYTAPLVLTGLAVAIPFQAGLFNIGAEGQLVMGALSAAAFGITFPHVPWPIAPVLAAFAAFLGGAVWGSIPGYLRAKRGSHEVINTIMLNFVAAGISSWVTLYLLKNPSTQNPETAPVGLGYLIHPLSWFDDAPVSLGLLIAPLVVFLVWILISKTVWGFGVRAVGQSENAARAGGINVARIRISAMTLAGGIAGLVAVPEVLTHSGNFKIGFSPDYGFMGIAVALLARGKPLGVLFAALLFGALHKGTGSLDLETDRVTRDLSLILQALVIFSVAAEALWSKFRFAEGAAGRAKEAK
jgi:simple sugar transport system permease protein